MSQRSDTSEWVIHFVHDRPWSVDPSAPANVLPPAKPVAFTNAGVPVYEEPLLSCMHALQRVWPASSFDVLSQIVSDGFLRPGWSFRGGSATIYGPSPAVCFTEMPLHALLTYAAERNKPFRVAPYGVAVLRRELFRADARPVIYGISGKHSESQKSDKTCTGYYRELDPSCGLSLWEQYRYVHTDLRSDTIKGDWTHEREWRWPYRGTDPAHLVLPYRDGGRNVHLTRVLGLPLWLEQQRYSFSRIILLVQTKQEADAMLNLLKTFQDGEVPAFAFPRSGIALANTRVLAVEDLPVSILQGRACRIEDVVFRMLQVTRITPSAPVLARVREAVDAAIQAAKGATPTARDESGKLECH